MDPSGAPAWRPQQSALDDAAGEALRNQQEANMVFGAFAAASSGLVPDANTNWEYGAGGLPLSELSCDYCRVQAVQCARASLADACQFCRDRNLECVGPGNNRRVKLFASVDQTLPGQQPSSGEYEIGQSVILRTGLETWDSTPRIVRRVIYKPVAVVLDDENSDPRPIEWIRPYPATWINGPPRPVVHVPKPVVQQQQLQPHHQQHVPQMSPQHQQYQQQQPMYQPQQQQYQPQQQYQQQQQQQQQLQHLQPQQPHHMSRPATPAEQHTAPLQPAYHQPQQMMQQPAASTSMLPISTASTPASTTPAPLPMQPVHPAIASTQPSPLVDTRNSSTDERDVKPSM